MSSGFVASCLLLLLGLCLGCGMRTHTEVAHRAQLSFDNPIYKKIINEHQDAFQGGSPFPDWGYLCGHHDEGEEIHWPKMINRVAQYVHSTYGGNTTLWNAETKKFVAFLLGIESHHISDVLFHSIAGVQSGLIRENAEVCFKGVYQDGHDSGDIGGDFQMIHGVGVPNWMSDRWYIPSKDLAEVYRLSGMPKVSASVLEKCSHLQFMLLMAIRAGGIFFYQSYASKSHFLTEKYFDYIVGGVDDMTLRTTQYWRDLIKIIKTGRVPSEVQFTTNDTRPDSTRILDWFGKNLEAIKAQFPTKTIKTDRGVYFELVNKPVRSVESIPVEKEIPALSNYGTSVSIVNNMVVVGAPGTPHLNKPYSGAIHIGNQMITPPTLETKFGSQVVFLDFNIDGIVDMVVSAPKAGITDRHFYPTGAVYVYYGTSNGTFSSVPNVTILGDFGENNRFSSIGHVLVVGDVNMDGHKDLLIGSPHENYGRGSVTVYFSKGNHLNRYMNQRDASLVIRSPLPHSYCGSSILVVPRGRVVIGCPITRLDRSRDSIGSVIVYQFQANQLVEVTRIHGMDHFEQFGSALAYGAPYDGTTHYLAVSSISKNVSTPFVRPGAGSVCLFIIDNLRGNLSISQIEKKVIFEGDRSFANFGKVIHFDDVNKDGKDEFFISEPLRDGPRGNHVGRVYMLMGGTNFPTGVVKNVSLVAKRVFESKTIGGRFGSSFETGIVDNKNVIVIGSPFDSSRSYFGGKVDVFQFYD